MNRSGTIRVVVVAASAAAFSLTACGAQRSGVGSAGSPAPGSIAPSATAPNESPTTVAASAGSEVPPDETSNSAAVSSPSYLTPDDLDELHTFSQQSVSFNGTLPLLSSPPAVLAGTDHVVVAQVAEIGDLLTVGFSAPAEASKEYPGGYWIMLNVGPANDESRAWFDALATPELMVGDLTVKLGADAAACGPIDEGGYDLTTLVWIENELIFSLESNPLVGCETSPFTIDDLLATVDGVVWCVSPASESLTCRARTSK